MSENCEFEGKIKFSLRCVVKKMRWKVCMRSQMRLISFLRLAPVFVDGLLIEALPRPGQLQDRAEDPRRRNFSVFSL